MFYLFSSVLRHIALCEGRVLYEVKDCEGSFIKHLFSLQEANILVSEGLYVPKYRHL